MATGTEALINRLIQMVDADAGYIGIGTGVAPTETDTLLDLEQQRKATTSFIDGATLIKEGYWDETEANGVTFTNAGLFGWGADSGIDTGSLMVGGSINVSKDSIESLTISVELTFEAVNT